MAPAERAGRARAPGTFGLLLVNKPYGPTSHDVVAWVRWALRERSVGHCGTLDPAASGLLVLCIGEATKLVEHLSAVDKSYRARFVLGASTTTADAQGEMIEEREVSEAMEARVAEVLASLQGPLELPPPVYSAIKLQGRRAHELARAGEITTLPPRSMAVHEIDFLNQGRTDDRVFVDADMRVAKGTYVRSLAEELGRRLGVPAHLGGLERTSCGELRLADPSAVDRGLRAHELEPIPGRPPKWRLELGESESESEGGEGEGDRDAARQAVSSRRDEMGASLRQALIEPWTRLPFAVSVLPESGPHEPLTARLLQGQRLPADTGVHEALGLDTGAGPCAVVEREAGRMIILEREPEAGRIAPRRVIRFDPSRAGSH